MAAGALTLPACDGGRHEVVRGTVHAETLCGVDGGVEPDVPDASFCPPCSGDDAEGLCRDAFYSTAVRCLAGDGQCERGGGACRAGFCVYHDRDHDDIDDDLQREVAERNMPIIHLHPDERCGGPQDVVYRVRRHPQAPDRFAITYVVLYDRDCGALNGHIGDNEAFSITVDLGARPGAPATVGLLTDAHRHTTCESVSTCETAPGTSGCAPSGSDRVVLYSSRDKHAMYFDRGVCAGNCLDECGDGKAVTPTLVDVGQPDAPLVSDLSASGMPLTLAAGWDASLLHFNPWSSGVFGHAGHVRDQLLSLLAPPGL